MKNANFVYNKWNPETYCFFKYSLLVECHLNYLYAKQSKKNNTLNNLNAVWSLFCDMICTFILCICRILYICRMAFWWKRLEPIIHLIKTIFLLSTSLKTASNFKRSQITIKRHLYFIPDLCVFKLQSIPFKSSHIYVIFFSQLLLSFNSWTSF